MNNRVPKNPVKNRETHSVYLTYIAGIMTAIYLTSNIMAVKLINVMGITLFDAGTITFPFAYMLGDTLTEIWGFKTTRRMILLTFVCNIIMAIFTALGTVLPAPEYMAETNTAFATVFTYVPRITAASLTAFLCGELSNAWFMVKIKELTGEKLLWVRTIGSSVIGYVADTVIFVLIAFAGTCPVRDLVSMIVIQYFEKLAIEALCGTPLAYALIGFLKKRVYRDEICEEEAL